MFQTFLNVMIVNIKKYIFNIYNKFQNLYDLVNVFI